MCNYAGVGTERFLRGLFHLQKKLAWESVCLEGTSLLLTDRLLKFENKNTNFVDKLKGKWYIDLKLKNIKRINKFGGIHETSSYYGGRITTIQGKLDLIFYAQQRITEEYYLTIIFQYLFEFYIGINASGKTSVLKVIFLALEIINNEPINHIEIRDILGDAKEVKLNMYFFSEKTNEICWLEIIIIFKKSKSEGISYSIVSESLWTKGVAEVTYT